MTDCPACDRSGYRGTTDRLIECQDEQGKIGVLAYKVSRPCPLCAGRGVVADLDDLDAAGLHAELARLDRLAVDVVVDNRLWWLDPLIRQRVGQIEDAFADLVAA